MNPLAAKACADCGLLVIVLPASLDLTCKALKAMPKRSVVDCVLGERTGCLVVGSKNVQELRKAIAGDEVMEDFLELALEGC